MYFYVVIPSKDKDGTEIAEATRDEVIANVMARCVQAFGGATAVPAVGAWKCPVTARIMQEEVTRIESYVQDSVQSHSKASAVISAVAADVKQALCQASVMHGTFHGQAWF